MTTIQVRDVSPEAAELLKKRAAARGLSLSEYLRGELDRLAAAPSRDEVLRRIAARGAPRLTSPVQELHAARDARSGE